VRPRFLRDLSGASAVELALVLPAFAALLIGFFNGCAMYWGQTALHFAVDDAARCWSVGFSCTTAAQARTFASTHYHGPHINSLTFTATSPASTEGGTGGYCTHPGYGNTSTNSVPGYIVSATGTYKFDGGLVSFNVPIAASACFPQFT
jgi:Flp pilus assembly protein TadG